MHPTSTLCAPDHAPAPTEVVLFGEMLETHRVFLCNCARAPAHALLLSASNVECDVYAERILVDRWLMLRVSTAGGGESLLVAASRLRLATRALLRERLRVSKGAADDRLTGGTRLTGKDAAAAFEATRMCSKRRTRRPRICWRRCAPRPCPRRRGSSPRRPSRRAAACSAGPFAPFAPFAFAVGGARRAGRRPRG